MAGVIDVLNPERPKRILLLASNPTISEQTSWPIGFWWAELTHPYWEFVERGYQVEVASPGGGALEGDKWSDPRDKSRYSADDLISLGLVHQLGRPRAARASARAPRARSSRLLRPSLVSPPLSSVSAAAACGRVCRCARACTAGRSRRRWWRA
jgi:hypothetical protein